MMMGVAMGLLTLVGAGAVHAQRAPVARGCVSVLPATVEMNTVAVGDLVKTVVMEKEVFHCFKWQSPRLPPPILPPEVVIDVQLFTELTERKVGDTFGTIEAGFHAVICKKDVAGARLEECENVRVPVLESAAVGGCVFESPSGGHPVAMTTVAIGDLVRTIKAQKEVFRCPSPAGEVFVDFTTFTEIVEKSEDDAFTQTQKRMHAAVCHKLLSNDPGGGFIKPLMPVRIAGCEDFPVSFRE
jgi:hypothetical protein